MSSLRLVLLGSSAVSLLALAAACGDDDAFVRTSVPDGGAADATVEASTFEGGDGGGSTCGITLPAEYLSAAFETNAKLELDLRTSFAAFLKPMVDAEGAYVSSDGGTLTQVTKATLDPLWQAGNPSVKSITTSYWQGRVDAWLAAYETATKAGELALPQQSSTPPASGGYYHRYVYDGAMIDLRQAIEKGSYTAAFFNHAVGIVNAGSLTEASVDRLVAAWGAHATFQNNHLATAGATNATRDVNSAGYAARRTPKDGKPGPYLRAKAALIKAKASIAAGAKCDADRDAAIKEFFLEWEKATYATVVFYYGDIVTKIAAAPDHSNTTAWTGILHSHGECLGFIGGFKTIPQARRKITDAQIDALLAKSYAPEAGPIELHKLKTSSTAAVLQLNSALADIKALYAFSDEEMTSFKTNYTKQ